VNCRSNGNKGRQLCRKLLTGLPCTVQEMDLTVQKNVFLNCAQNIKEHLDKLVNSSCKCQDNQHAAHLRIHRKSSAATGQPPLIK